MWHGKITGENLSFESVVQMSDILFYCLNSSSFCFMSIIVSFAMATCFISHCGSPQSGAWDGPFPEKDVIERLLYFHSKHPQSSWQISSVSLYFQRYQGHCPLTAGWTARVTDIINSNYAALNIRFPEFLKHKTGTGCLPTGLVKFRGECFLPLFTFLEIGAI